VRQDTQGLDVTQSRVKRCVIFVGNIGKASYCRPRVAGLRPSCSGMIRLRFTGIISVVLFVTVILWLAPNANAAFTITLTPNTGAAGTLVTITGSEPNIGAPSLDSSCQVTSSPVDIISNPTCTVTQSGEGNYTVSGSFTVASGANPGPYTVTVTVTLAPFPTPYATASATFTVPSPTPILEYPLGLPLLAILLVIGYGLVRRRINY
jgi:hypothetical protein